MDERIEKLEQSLARLDAEFNQARIAKSQRFAFVGAVACHIALAWLVNLLVLLLPSGLINGWMFGTLVTASVWFAASARPIFERTIRLVVAGTVCWMSIVEVHRWKESNLPDVAYVGILLAPALWLAARMVLGAFHVTMNAPDIVNGRSRKLSLVDILVTISVACLHLAGIRAMSDFTTPGALHELLSCCIVISFGVLITSCNAVALVCMASVRSVAARLGVVGASACCVLCASWLVPKFLSQMWLESLSWVDADLLVSWNSMSEAVPEEQVSISDVGWFVTSLVACPVLTFGYLKMTGYTLSYAKQSRN